MSKALVPIGSEKAGSELIQLVSFSLDNEEYAVEVLKVREIIRMPEITHMPNTPHYAEGIINLRGKVIPVISLRKKFSLMDTENDSHTRVMAMADGGGAGVHHRGGQSQRAAADPAGSGSHHPLILLFCRLSPLQEGGTTEQDGISQADP